MNATKWLLLTSISLMVVTAAGFMLWFGGRARVPDPATGPRGLASKTSRRGHYRVGLAPLSGPVEVGLTQSWVLWIHDPNDAPLARCKIKFDGWMPEHGHGLPTEPRVTQERSDGAYVVEGVRLSMPGFWELKVDVSGCGPSDTAIHALHI
ncbi:MAG TPA: FixH family protein [Polyangiaceae bacterium]|nr:FixH family protein [Polyangiaceae bacterium]